MRQKTLITAEFRTPADTTREAQPADTDWTRSFPEGSVEGSGWMLDVLEDLHAYARHHQLNDAEDLLADTRRKLARMLRAN
ncbi:hypothetical protein SAMN06297129_1531 [Pseudooceanicola antarcticus]|uniref:Uncharacterized protein n=1 Tax=Pseudooceanicola antarcticus TaxID=1247613 RepID=A0A285IL89_9RHOB|nr:hypothetical protein [Pseudooceanicola antarcticus]SNY48663.1 hypothetical protein SAMN06297129_1531 [Pseudooceanicola antarcticus]